jgi:hypothetical protein
VPALGSRDRAVGTALAEVADIAVEALAPARDALRRVPFKS